MVYFKQPDCLFPCLRPISPVSNPITKEFGTHRFQCLQILFVPGRLISSTSDCYLTVAEYLFLNGKNDQHAQYDFTKWVKRKTS